VGDGADAALNYLFKEPFMSFVVPDACTLPTVERPLRLGEFDRRPPGSCIQSVRPPSPRPP
jgi:hypothetical protein